MRRSNTLVPVDKSYSVITTLIGDSVSFRSRKRSYSQYGSIDEVKTMNPPLREMITLYDDKDQVVTYWVENIGYQNIQHDKNYRWIDLGVGLIPYQRYGLRRALFDLALGYLSGFPVRDVLAFVWNFSLSKKRAHKILRREGFIE